MGTMLSIKDPFTFEFLGLDARDAVSESVRTGSYGPFVGIYVKRDKRNGDVKLSTLANEKDSL